MIEVIVLTFMIIIAAAIAVESRSLFSSEVAFGVVGTLLCAVFFVLRAPEVAIAQLIVELLVLVIMLRVTDIDRDLSERPSKLHEWLALMAIIATVACLGVVFTMALNLIPRFGEPLMTISKSLISLSQGKHGAQNIVSFILFEVRWLDIIAASSVLFAGAVGVGSILRHRGRKAKDERHV